MSDTRGDDDLLSCFLWAAGENAIATPSWESPSVNPLKGIPLPPSMPPLPPAAGHGAGLASGLRAPKAPIGDILEEDDDVEDSKSALPLSKEQKLTQRMQRKAESARVARLRKKDYVTGLEEKLSQLEKLVVEQSQRIASLEKEPAARASTKQHEQGAPAPQVPHPGLREEGQRELSHMDDLLRQPNLDRLEVNATVESYVANKRAQQQTVNEYLDSIEDILSPAAPLQVAFNPETGSYDDALTSAATSSDTTTAAANVEPLGKKRNREEGRARVAQSVGSQLMSTLATELGLNGAQVDALSQQKDAIRADREIVSACMRQIQLLRTHVAEHINSSQRVTDELRRILEPTQVATFLLWVERNQRSMNLLNSIVATDSTD